MDKLVVIDSNIFIWGIKGQATEGQEDMIGRAKDLIEFLSNSNYRILLPVPQMVELMSILPISDQPTLRKFIDKTFMVAPFDELAAIKCAELLHLSLNDTEISELRKEGKIQKNRIKYDCMIVAISIVRGVSKIYSEDSDLRRFAHGQIEVYKMPIFHTILDLFGNKIGKQIIT